MIGHYKQTVIGTSCYTSPWFALLQKESSAKAVGTLIAGLVATAASVAGVLGMQAMIRNLG